MRGTLVNIIILALMIIPLFGICYFSYVFSKTLYCKYRPYQDGLPPVIKNIEWKNTGLITLWFDDAYKSQASKKILDFMASNQLVGAVSVPTDYICDPKFLTWDQLKELQQLGWEITSHTVSHYCEPDKYNEKNIPYEVLYSKYQLESKGLRADNFVIPCGFNQTIVPEVWKLAKAHYKSYRMAKEKVNPLPIKNPYDLYSFSISSTTPLNDIKKWIDEAATQKAWLILTFHQIDEDGYRYHTDFDRFKQIIAMVKQSGLPVVLPTQALNIQSRQM